MGTVKFGGRRSWGTEVQPKIKDLLWRVLRGFFLLGKGLKVEGLILMRDVLFVERLRVLIMH